MKRFIKILGLFLLLVFVSLLVLPFVFKGALLEKVKQEINQQVMAKVDFESFSLSFIKNFPNAAIQLEGFSVVGIGDFKGDTLMYSKSVVAVADLSSLFSDEGYRIRKFEVVKPHIFLHVNASGVANYDIAVPSVPDTVVQAPVEEMTSAFQIQLNRVNIVDGRVRMRDDRIGYLMVLEGLNHSLSGDFSLASTWLKTSTTIEQAYFNYEGIAYLNHARVALVADIDADLEAMRFRFGDNRLLLNELEIQADGTFTLPENGYGLDFKFAAPKADFRQILSMIPAIYLKDFDQLTADGTLSLNGYVKGRYTEEQLPAFGLNLMVDKGRFQYQALPESIENIQLSAEVKNKGGDADNTLVNIKQLHLEMGGDPLDVRFSLATPLSDPMVNASIKGHFDLGHIASLYPLPEGIALQGEIVSNLQLAGKLSSIEQEKYADFIARGRMTGSRIQIENASLPAPLIVEKAELEYAPDHIEVTAFQSKIGNSDLFVKGKVENYLPYFLKGGTIRGNFILKSNILDVNEWMVAVPETTPGAQKTDTASVMEVILVPDNIDFLFASTIKHLEYDQLQLDKVMGRIRVHNREIELQKLQMQALDGEIEVNGLYSTLEPERPTVDFDLDLQKVDIAKTYRAFDVMEKLAPIAEKAGGTFSTTMKFRTALTQEMIPDLTTINGLGSLSATQVELNHIASLDKVGNALKIEELKQLVLDNIQLQFEVMDGRVAVQPFDAKMGDIFANIGGTTGFDESLDYTMKLKIPKTKFGGAANQVLDNLIGEAAKRGLQFNPGEFVDVDVLIGGSIKTPTVRTSLARSAGSTVDELRKKAEQELQKKKEELAQKARKEAEKYVALADAKAEDLIREAEKRAEQIRKAADVTASELRQQADKQSLQLIEEGKKKGPIASIAAKKAAESIVKEADKKADKLIGEADYQAENLLSKARNQAAKIKKEARDKYLKP